MKTIASFVLRAALCIAAALLFNACVGMVPRPASPTIVEHGHRLKPADIAFIQPGVTPRADVITRLGTNYAALPMNRAIAYSWEMKGGGGVWWYFLVAGYAGAAANAGSWEGGWRACFIAFDDQAVITRTEFKCLSTRRSLHEHMYAWLGHPTTQPAVVYREPFVDIAPQPMHLPGKHY